MISKLRAFLLLGLWFLAIAVIGPFSTLLCRITGKDLYLFKPIRLFVRIGLAMVGVKVRVSGLERVSGTPTCIFTPNHQSFIEVPILITYLDRDVAFIAKKELFDYPIFGAGIRQVGMVPVDRSNRQAAIESTKLAIDILKQGKSYVVYPEGTRSPDGRLLSFKKGAFLMAIEAGVPVVPVTISGSCRIMPKGAIAVNSGTITVTVHDPVSTEGYSRENVNELIAQVKGKVASALVEARSVETEI